MRAKVPGAQQLLLTRYDVDTQQWDGANFSLSIPEESTSFEAILMPQATSGEPSPIVRIKAASGSVYENSLNDDATDWADGNWTPIQWSTWSAIDPNFTIYPPPPPPGSLVASSFPGHDGERGRPRPEPPRRLRGRGRFASLPGLA